MVASLLEDLDEYVSYRSLLSRFGGVPKASELLPELAAQDILVVQGSPLDALEREVDDAWIWGHEARYFHFATRQVQFEHDPAANERRLEDLARLTPQPPPFKDSGPADISLPGTFEQRKGEFWDTLRARRTRRSFARQPISLQDFADVLLWTWGHTDLKVDPSVGPYILKTSPSGGARHPIEVYPVVLRVQDIEPGVYYYSVREHALRRLKSGDFEDDVVRVCGGQTWVRNAAVVFFMTAMLARTMWKYPNPHAYRVVLLDAGHVGQTFHLVCTRLGLAPLTTAATHDPEVERLLGIDGVAEVPVYAAAMGLPAES